MVYFTKRLNDNYRLKFSKLNDNKRIELNNSDRSLIKKTILDYYYRTTTVKQLNV